MKKNDKKLVVETAKGLMVLTLSILGFRFIPGIAAAGAVVFSVISAFSGKMRWALVGYALYPFLVIINPGIMSHGTNVVCFRVGTYLLTIALLFSAGSRRGRHALPLGGLLAYLLVAFLSSMGGYYPMISYLKIFNCILFFSGFWLGLRNIDKRPQDVIFVRKFFLVLVCFIIFGSIATLAAPGIAYRTSIVRLADSVGMQEATLRLKEMTGVKLFCGVTNQSQCLAILLPVALAWMACDMLFVERRLTLLHGMALVCGLPLLYMTRSRSAFLSATVAVSVIYFYGLGKVRLRESLRRKLRTGMVGMIGLVVLVCAVMEVRNNSISRWLRKTEDVQSDVRGFGEAFTASRMGKVSEGMRDFERNPLLGSGFQVSYDMQYWGEADRLILSAPIEKGVLPVMILGETGVLGLIVFVLFLTHFYVTCVQKHYIASLTLMTVMIASNMAEATFFSPGGAGGTLWMISVVGGFIIDMVVLCRRKLEFRANLMGLQM